MLVAVLQTGPIMFIKRAPLISVITLVDNLYLDLRLVLKDTL